MKIEADTTPTAIIAVWPVQEPGISPGCVDSGHSIERRPIRSTSLCVRDIESALSLPWTPGRERGGVGTC